MNARPDPNFLTPTSLGGAGAVVNGGALCLARRPNPALQRTRPQVRFPIARPVMVAGSLSLVVRRRWPHRSIVP